MKGTISVTAVSIKSYYKGYCKGSAKLTMRTLESNYGGVKFRRPAG